ncbi:N-acetylglucosamine transport system permease protein [Paenibacillus sp. yr247]|uniref:carbohydrate ABC transporter permease n=1 Tax=Paenibacillus sp. yr247 TaxID=1761880 RepID=UPI000884EE92|nr:carbohydrate ABC transporter permease [Paenibacillus sp. yr247]SDO33024.1 N-acetylglucosamine transport system permease protein [Paenibacillus sp. yr247]
MQQQSRYLQELLWILLIIALLIVIAPIFWVILGSFKTNTEIFGSPFSLPKSWNFDNMASAWVLGNFKMYFMNSTVITVLGMLIVLLVACPAGYVLAQIPFRGSKWMFYLFLFGMAIPVQAIIIPLFYQLKSIGLINTLTGVTLVSAGLAVPFSVFLIRNTFKDVPPEMREAALIDGAEEWTTFFCVMLPMAKPGIVALMVFTFMQIWNDFLLPLVLLIDNSKFTVALGLHSLNVENSTNYGLVFGGTLISMVPSIIVYLLFQRQFISGMAAGSGK